MAVDILIDPALEALTIAHVEIEHVVVAPGSVKLSLWSDEVSSAAIEQSKRPAAESLRASIRKLLRHGKFKASGRSKPAQEYLLRCALEEGSLPRINGPVDVLNTVSLACGLPISLLSLRKCSSQFEIRRGLADEAYVFNSSGQLLDIEDLVVACDRTDTPSRPVGSPIKDSMAGKIDAGDTALVAIIYAPADAIGIETAALAAAMLREKMIEFCDASIAVERFSESFRRR